LGSLSKDEQWFAYSRATPGKDADRPRFLVIRNVSSGQEEVITDDVASYPAPAIWLSGEELIYENISDEIVQMNIHTRRKQTWTLKKGISPGALSADGLSLLCDDYLIGGRNIFLLDLKDHSLKRVMRSWFFLIQSADFWSPDGKSFIYTRHDWTNWSPFHEVGHLFWRDLATGKEIKVADKVALFGGFWLPEDPAKVGRTF
jgi:hypothetical protein